MEIKDMTDTKLEIWKAMTDAELAEAVARREEWKHFGWFGTRMDTPRQSSIRPYGLRNARRNGWPVLILGKDSSSWRQSDRASSGMSHGMM